MPDPRRALGARGERAAVKALKRAGYRIRARNYRTKLGEIDIIAEQDGVIAFVEVKTRADDALGLPSDAVTARKQARVHKAARQYIRENSLHSEPCRFDVVSIVWPTDVRKPEIEIIPDAFRA